MDNRLRYNPNQRFRRLDPKNCFSLTRAWEGASKLPVGGPARNSTSTRPTLISSKLDIAGTNPTIGRGSRAALEISDNCGCYRACRPFRKYACLWRSNTRHIAHCIHIREASLEGLRVNRDPAIHGHAAGRNHLGHAVLWDTEE